MSNQTGSEFVLNANSSIALNDGISIISPQVLNNLSPGAILDSNLNNDAHAWKGINNVNYSLNTNDNHQLARYTTESITQIQDQNMSQTAQIVLLPTQNLNLVANVPKQEQVQMILPNDVSYQIISSIPNVSVLMPTNILLTNGLVLIPQTQNSIQNLPLSSPVQENESNEFVTSNKNLFIKGWINNNQDNQQQQIITDVDFDLCTQQQLDPDCEYITLADTGTQTMLSAIPDGEVNHTAHLVTNNGQILGIIGSDQLSILQNEQNSENQVLLAIDPNENINLVSQQTSANYDINTFLASTISSAPVEKTDQKQAKQWLRDSCIVNRALKALKKSNSQQSRLQNNNRPLPVRR